jgi:hypothetical protein
MNKLTDECHLPTWMRKRQIAALKAQVAELQQQLADLRNLRGADEPWYWQGDGGDDLESMSAGMVVHILAGDLRRLVSQQTVCNECGADIPKGQGFGRSGEHPDPSQPREVIIEPMCLACMGKRMSR